MLCKCKECGTLFERSENAVRCRPEVLCRSCAAKLANSHKDKKAVYEKRKNTCLERYGVTNPSKLDSVKDKQKETCLRKYGVSSPLCLNENNQLIDFFGDKHVLVEKTQCLIDNNVKLIRVSELQKFFNNFKPSE